MLCLTLLMPFRRLTGRAGSHSLTLPHAVSHSFDAPLPPHRQNDDGTLTRESNARYVEWSDGTESIMLGDEVLEIDRKQQPRANTYVHVVRYDAIQVGGCMCRWPLLGGGNGVGVEKVFLDGPSPHAALLRKGYLTGLHHTQQPRASTYVHAIMRLKLRLTAGHSLGCVGCCWRPQIRGTVAAVTLMRWRRDAVLTIPPLAGCRCCCCRVCGCVCVQGLSHIKQTIHCKPASLNSKLHQRLKMTVHKASAKTDKVRLCAGHQRPDSWTCTTAVPSLQGMHWVCCAKCCCPDMCLCHVLELKCWRQLDHWCAVVCCVMLCSICCCRRRSKCTWLRGTQSRRSLRLRSGQRRWLD